MESTPFQIAYWGFILLTILCLGIFLYGLRYGLQRSNIAPERHSRIFWGTAIGILAWMIISGVLAANGVFSDFESFPPKMFLNIIVPLVAVIIVSTRKTTHEILDGIPPRYLIAFQSFRIPVEIFLWCLLLAGSLPIQMTFEGLNYDILSGIGGAIVAILLWKGIGHARRMMAVYNVVGLALLFTIVLIAVLSMPLPFRQFMNEPANRIVTTFPFVWLPGLLVTLAYTLHIFSFIQLRRA